MLRRQDGKVHNNASDKQFRHRPGVIFKDWDIKIMSYVMTVIVMIALIAATVAWFRYYKVASVSRMGMMTASCESLRLEVKKDRTPDSFVEVKEGQENIVFADFIMPVFDNVETYEVTEDGDTRTVNKMAPGVYGSLTVRLTALNREINHYKLSPQTIFNYVDSVNVNLENGIPAEAQTDSNVIILQALAKGHLQFYKSCVGRTKDENGIYSETVEIDNVVSRVEDYTHNQRYVYYNRINSGEFLEGSLEWDAENNEGIPTEVTIYWYWPYEYANLGSDIKSEIQLPKNQALQGIINDERLKYFDKDKMAELEASSGAWNEIQLYDYADTKIGTFVKSIRIRLEVEGYHETGNTQ